MAIRPVAAALGQLRLADTEDAPTVLTLVNESMSKTFRITGVHDIVYLIETCVLSIIQLDADGVIVGFIATKDSPSMPSLHPSAWVEYIWTKYKTIEMNSRNTLFIHLLCWNPIYAREIVDNMLKSIFMHDPYLQYLAFIKTLLHYQQLVPGQARSEASFRRVQAMERGMSGDQLPAMSLCERKEVSPRLRIRRAVEEDNDDLVPIIDRHSKRLRELYGEFYISELISRHPESDRVLLVCEHKELAVGLMVLNTTINYSSLEECFDLSPFAGLRHLDAAAAYHHAKEMESNASFVSEPNLNQTVDSSYFLETMANSRDPKSRVTWSYEEDEFRDFRTSVVPSPRESDMAHFSSHMVIMDLFDQEEEEEVEFDIVNIDPELWKLPQLFSPMDNVVKNIEKQKEHPSAVEENNKKNKKRPSTAAKTPEPIIRYTGTSNAFLLEIFVMQNDYDERYGFDMLEVAFELFPDREYCVLSLPSSHPPYPLLEHFTLVTPHCSRMRFINETLYVTHINSVRGDIRVRPGEQHDVHNLVDILEHAARKEALMELFETSLISSPLESYVLLSQNQPIGVIVIGPLEDGFSIRSQYDLQPEPRQPGTDCAVLAGIMSPIMEPHSRWFMRDVLRQSRYSTLFWICQPVAKGESSPVRNMMSLAERMAPVRPRRMVPNISGSKDIDKIVKDVSTPFSLWMLERPSSTLPKVYINNSIVVVGASRTGLAFLEALIMGPSSTYLTFTNITLVSEYGLPTVVECLKAAETCVPRDGRYSDRYLKSVPFCFYVDVMSAVMINIDRKKKCIHLKGGGVKYYDELVLTCGQQFQHPDYMKESLELVKELIKGKPCDRMLMDNPKYQPDRVPPPPDLPENVLLINSLYQANMCLKKLLRMVTEEKDSLTPQNQIVVYGDCIEAYCCIAALLEIGVLAQEIAFVEPFPPEDPAAMRVNCFNDEVIDDRVQLSLANLGIRVLRECRLSQWRIRGRRVVSLRLMSPMHCINLSCFALFYYGLKAIDLYAFKAINESGLVYDGGLVVGAQFETNDPNVFGAGSCVQYSRRLYASQLLHRYYYSEDVGEALAQFFLKKLDPFVMMNQTDFGTNPADVFPRYSSGFLFGGSRISLQGMGPHTQQMALRWQPVMKFESPIVHYATLPGPLYYLKVRKPGPDIPMEVHLTLPHQGHTLITDKNGNYFRLQLNVLHCVDTVTCLSKEVFSPEIFSQLYGKHEAFFNKLLTRYQMTQIDDLFEFFTQPWMAAMYQETFEELLSNINSHDVCTMHELMKSKFKVSLGIAKSASSSQFGSLDQDRRNIGTFRSLVKQATRSSVEMFKVGPTDIPSECGQSPEVRAEAASLWQAVSGERLVLDNIKRFLARNSVTNPHYAPPLPNSQ